MVALNLPTVGGDDDIWGGKLNTALTALETAVNELVDEQTATQVVPLQVTGQLAATAFPISAASYPQGTVRYPVKFPVEVSRIRVHVRNQSYVSTGATGFTGDIALTGLWWGEARMNLDSFVDGGFKASPGQIAGPGNMPTNADEWVSPWATVNAPAGVDHLISLGWSITSNPPTNLVANWTRHWRSTSAANAGQQAPALTAGGGTGAPFDVWIECEISAHVPKVAFIGDSITIGDMYTQCFPLRYGLTHKVWPIVFGHFGGGLTDWGSGSIGRWTKFGAALGVDATLIMCGVNDILLNASDNDMKNRMTATMARVRTYLGPRIFFGTIMPTNSVNMTAPREAVRVSHNTWMTFFRAGSEGTIDMAKAVATPGTPSQYLAAYTWDGTHPNEAGAVQLANAIPHLIH